MSAENTVTDPRRGTVLAVDDSARNLRVLLETLSDAGYEVLVANDGTTAIETTRYARPDLILLDVLMPGLDGFDTCRKLKEDPETREIPIIFMTAVHETTEKVKAFELGAVDFVTKPFAEAELLARVHTHISLARLRADLEERNRRLHNLNQLKNEFLGMAAHDIRNPLATIIATADLIAFSAGSKTPEELQKFANGISTAATRINTLITNLLDVNAIETGARRIQLQDVDLRAILQETVENNRINADKKDITIHLVDRCENSHATLDPNAVLQVLDNVLSNAVKYSPKGSIVTVTIHESDARLRIEIADQGPGLSEADQAKMFQKFCRLSPKPTGGEPSNGLGLWIVKQLTESLGGSITCRSKLGEGSTFIIEWPRHPQTGVSEAA